MDIKCKLEIKDEPLGDAEEDSNNEKVLQFVESQDFGIDLKHEIEVKDGLVDFKEEPKYDEEFYEIKESRFQTDIKSEDEISPREEKNEIILKEEVESSEEETFDDKFCENNFDAELSQKNNSDILNKNVSESHGKEIQTQTNKKRLWNCSDCSYESNRKPNLKRHMQTQSCAKLFKCAECDYNCKQKRNLINHMLKHSDAKLYKCSECSFNCKYKKDIQKHERKHLGPKLFKCTECNSEFNYKVLLTYHMQKHSDVKSKLFKCSECSYEFHRKEHLNRHMIKHSKEKFKCTECNYECTQQGYLKRHISKHGFKADTRSLRPLAPASSKVSVPAPAPTFFLLIPSSSSSLDVSQHI